MSLLKIVAPKLDLCVARAYIIDLSPAPILQVGVAAEVLITPAVSALAPTVGYVLEVGASGRLCAPP